MEEEKGSEKVKVRPEREWRAVIRKGAPEKRDKLKRAARKPGQRGREEGCGPSVSPPQVSLTP